MQNGNWSRRKFLVAFGTTLSGMLASCRPESRLVPPTIYSPGSTPQPTNTPTPFAVPSALPTQPLPASVPVTDIDKLYVKSYRLVPETSALENFTLTIDGLVDNPLTLTMDEIRAMPTVDSMRTLECISNPIGGGLVGNIVWTGTDIAPILQRAGVKASATHVSFQAADGYTTTVALQWIMQAGVLLVHGANGEPLPLKHGYPLRILMPGLYGQKMPKWITRITFTDKDSLGYWEGPAYGWSNVAAVKTNSKIFQPDRKLTYANPIRIEGMAFGGGRAITAVEVSTQGLDRDALWHPATLIAPPDPLAWTWWVYDWTPDKPGNYDIAVRATDETGFTQFESPRGMLAGAFPEGTNAIHVQSTSVL